MKHAVKKWIRSSACLFALFTVSTFVACSSAPYKTQKYASLSNTKVFEEDYEMVWKAILAAVSEIKLDEEDSESGRIRTDWIYSTSNDKYLEYSVNGFPRKRYLQTRYKFLITAEKQLGGVKVTVIPEEEVERLKSDGSFESWVRVSEPETIRANEMVGQINQKILARPNL